MQYPIYTNTRHGQELQIHMNGEELKVYNKLMKVGTNETYKNDIIVSQQTDEEIEEDIINIIKELNNKKIIIVGHIVTYNKGKRYELINLLEQICNKYNILFINPITEITKLGYNIKDLVIDEPIISHYNELGHSVIEKIYNHYICQN